LYIVWWNS